MKIAYSGTFGTGKTYSTYMKAMELKRQYPEKEVATLVNVERECPLPINKDTNFEAQMWILSRKIQEEIHLSKIYDHLVCDCTVMDVVAYVYAAGLPEFVQMYKLASAWVDSYDEIYIKNTSRNNWLQNDGCRETDKSYRSQVENILTDLYDNSSYKSVFTCL